MYIFLCGTRRNLADWSSSWNGRHWACLPAKHRWTNSLLSLECIGFNIKTKQFLRTCSTWAVPVSCGRRLMTDILSADIHTNFYEGWHKTTTHFQWWHKTTTHFQRFIGGRNWAYFRSTGGCGAGAKLLIYSVLVIYYPTQGMRAEI